MDEKTLEYMGERVDKARKLQKEINLVNGNIKRLQDYECTNIVINPNWGHAVRLGTGGSEYAHKKALPAINEAITNILASYRDSLQKELDEI